MGGLNVRLGDMEVVLDHIKRAMSEDALETKHVPAVTEVLDGERMAELVGLTRGERWDIIFTNCGHTDTGR